MDKQLIKKITTFSFLVAAALSYVVVNILFKSLASIFGPVSRLHGIEAVNHGLPIAVAVIVFFVLQFNSKIVEWADEVVTEVSKVVWPSQKDTTAMTMVVCVFVGIASLMLLVIDFVAHNLVQMIIQ